MPIACVWTRNCPVAPVRVYSSVALLLLEEQVVVGMSEAPIVTYVPRLWLSVVELIGPSGVAMVDSMCVDSL